MSSLAARACPCKTRTVSRARAVLSLLLGVGVAPIENPPPCLEIRLEEGRPTESDWNRSFRYPPRLRVERRNEPGRWALAYAPRWTPEGIRARPNRFDFPPGDCLFCRSDSAASDTLRFAWGEIARLERRDPGNRLGTAIAGGFIGGLVAAAATGLALGHDCEEFECAGAAIAALLAMPIGAVAGATVGALAARGPRWVPALCAPEGHPPHAAPP